MKHILIQFKEKSFHVKLVNPNLYRNLVYENIIPFIYFLFFSLRRHMKCVHDGETFHCPMPNCQYKATWKDGFNNHVKSVHDCIAYQCPHCNYNATQKGNLQRHIKSAHDEEIISCSYFKYKTASTRKNQLNIHIRSVNEGIKFPCLQCSVTTKLLQKADFRFTQDIFTKVSLISVNMVNVNTKPHAWK